MGPSSPIGHDGYVKSVAFDNNTILASGSGDGTIKLWNKNTGDLLRTLSGHGSCVESVAFESKAKESFDNNDILASNSMDKTG